MDTARIVSGSYNRALAKRIAEILHVDLVEPQITKFSNNETSISFHRSIRGADVYLIIPTAADPNDSLMELLIMADAVKRSSPARLVAVVPTFGYSRQDKCEHRGPISFKLVANLMESVGFDRILTIDLHSSTHQGFFDIPVDNLTAQQLFINYAKSRIQQKFSLENAIVFSVGVSNVKFVKGFSDALGLSLGILHFGKLNKGGIKDNVISSIEDVNVIGDVAGRTCILYQDLEDTCSLITLGAQKLSQMGASSVIAFSTHTLFSGDALEKMPQSKIDLYVTTNSLNHAQSQKCFENLVVLDLSPLLAEAIRRTFFGESLSHLFDKPNIPFDVCVYQHQED